MNKKYLSIAIGLVVLVSGVIFFANKFSNNGQKVSQTENQKEKTEKIKIVVSFYPLADFAKNVGGDMVDVINITPAGAEPHDYEPTPQDIASVYNAKLFLLNGNGVDAWADKIIPDLLVRGVTVVKMSDFLDSLKNNQQDEGSEQYDPHFWLSPVNASKEAGLIAEALIKIDPEHKNEYNINKVVYQEKLAALDQEFKSGLAICEQREIVTSHNAFNYLASQYNLGTLFILGLSPEEDPSAKTIADLSNVARQKSIKYIFFETLVSPKLSQTLAAEIGAKTLELNPIEGLTKEDISIGKDYISEMKNNLQNLKIALQCQ